MLRDYLVHARGVSVVVHAGGDRCITFWEIAEVHSRGLYVEVHAGGLLSYIPGDCGSTC